MFDMLFVSSAHTLSPYIFSLYDRYKQFTDQERVSIKEPLDPGARFVPLTKNESVLCLLSGLSVT